MLSFCNAYLGEGIVKLTIKTLLDAKEKLEQPPQRFIAECGHEVENPATAMTKGCYVTRDFKTNCYKCFVNQEPQGQGE